MSCPAESNEGLNILTTLTDEMQKELITISKGATAETGEVNGSFFLAFFNEIRQLVLLNI